MEKTRKIKIISLCALLVAVLGFTVAFAALSQTLTINGSANMDAASWDIHFEKTIGKETEVKGAATFTEPTLSGTTIENFSATLTKPGDSVTYYFDIVNNGTVDAILPDTPTISLSYSKCIGTSKLDTDRWEACKVFDLNKDDSINTGDYAKIKKMFNYGIFYVDSGAALKANDAFNAGETKQVKLVVEYNYEAEELPENNFDIFDSSKSIELYFEQAD